MNLRNQTAPPEADLRAACFSTFLFVCLCIRENKTVMKQCWVELRQVFIIIIIVILILNIAGLKQSGRDITRVINWFFKKNLIEGQNFGLVQCLAAISRFPQVPWGVALSVMFT